MQFDFFHNHRLPRRAETIRIAEKEVPLLFVANARARRYILRVRPDGTARVTVPRRGSMRAAREFAERNAQWIADQLQRQALRPRRKETWAAGVEILFRGERVKIEYEMAARVLNIGDQRIVCDEAMDFREIIEQHLWSLAVRELPSRVVELAKIHHAPVRKVTVRNQKSRWGSCSQRGTISLNWRLIQTPPFVSDYIILHELMHLRQMNHSPRFWREVELVCPEFRNAEKWLTAHASLLR